MRESIKMLLVESNYHDYLLLKKMIEEAIGERCLLHRVSDIESAKIEIRDSQYDFFIFDNGDCKNIGLKLIDEVNAAYDFPPAIILISASWDRRADLRAMNAGADDYLVKSDLSPVLLEKSVRYALQHKQDEERLSKLAHYDSLTGLYNRSLFYNCLDNVISRASRNNVTFAVLMLDLDNFKIINDTLGHAAGDELLLKASARLRKCVRRSDDIARLGGDEFAVVAHQGSTPANWSALVEKLIQSFEDPFLIAGESVTISTSIGVSVFPEDSESRSELLKQADLALYHAKAMGRSTYAFFDSELDKSAKNRLSIIYELKKGLQENQLVLYYQPILDCDNQKLLSVEALIRWNHPKLGLMMPDYFIPLAETTGVIHKLGEFVVHCACKQHVAWKKAGMGEIVISVNISANQFKNKELSNNIINTVNSYQINPAHIGVEITETVLMDDMDLALKQLNRLSDFGIKLSLDDFGTGYSSLAYLRLFPTDNIKIDRSLISHIDTNQKEQAICSAIAAIGKALNMRVIAEGVETESQYQKLKSFQCGMVQGFHFSKPLSARNFQHWYVSQQKELSQSIHG